MINFILAVFFLIITPGPGVLSAAGVGAAFGWNAGVKYIFGLFLGTNTVAIAVIVGVAVWVESNDLLRFSLSLVSTVYLLFLAYKIATANHSVSFESPTKKPGVLAGFILQPLNPKAYFVNTILFTGFALYPENFFLEVIVKFIILNSIWLPIHFFWLFLGVYLKSLNLGDKSRKLLNSGLGTSLVIVVVLAVISSAS